MLVTLSSTVVKRRFKQEILKLYFKYCNVKYNASIIKEMDINVKSCITNAKNGQLREVLNMLDGKFNSLKAEEALKITACICNASISSECKDRFTASDISNLLIICMKAIENLDKNSMNTFLASIYYIIKYLIDKKDCGCIIRLEPDLIKILKNNLGDSALIKLCRNIYKIIYNGIFSKISNIDSDISTLCIFSMKILLQTKKLSDSLKEEVLEYFKNFNYLQLHIQQQYNIYMFVINLFKMNIDENQRDDCFDSMMNLLNILVQGYFRENNFITGRELILVTTKIFENSKSDKLKSTLTVIENVIGIVCTQNEFPSNIEAILSVVSECFQKLYQDKKFIQSLPNFLKFLHLTLYTAMQNFRTFPKEFWHNLSAQSQVTFSKFISHLTVSLTWIKSKCKTCQDCLSNGDLLSAANISVIPAHLVKYSLSNGNISDMCDILNNVKKCLDLSCMIIQKLQEFKCKNWNVAWIETGTLMYNLSIFLYRAKNLQAGFYMIYFIKKLILFEGVHCTILKENILNAALLSLTEHFVVTKDYDNAMLISSFNIYLHLHNRESAFWQWIRIKSSEKDNVNLQNFNLVSVIMKYESSLLDIYSSFNLTHEEKKDLLLFELKQYKAWWPSKVSIVSAIKELYSLDDIFITSKGIVSTWGGNVENTVPVDLYDIIVKVVSEFEDVLETQFNVENSIYIAFLYLIKYYSTYRKTQQENREDMEATRVTPIQCQETIEKNDECDVVSSYKHLNFEVHQKMMEYLKKSFDTFKSQIQEENKRILKEMNVYVTLVKIANEYLLHSQNLEYVQAWMLCYHLGKILEDKICIIESIGNLIEKSNLQSNFIKNILIEAEDLITQVNSNEEFKEGDDATRKWIVLMNFYINHGLAHLNHGNVDASLNTFQQVKSLYDGQIDKTKYELLRIRFEFFEWRLQLLPCVFNVKGHTNVLSKPHFLIESISQCYKIDGHNTYVLSLLFQIYCSVLHMYRWLRQPREVRCYGKEILIVAQELVIPFKSVQILSYLADADLLSCRLDDCRVKINGICDMLGHSKDKTSVNYSASHCEKFIENNVNCITNAFQEMMLDLPTTRRQYQASPGSPILLRDPFKVPSFIEHSDLCGCFCCLSVNYQELVMMCINLQANMHYYEQNLDIAREYYQGALCIYKTILKRENCFHQNVEKILGAQLLPSITDMFREIYCIILLGLGNTLIKDDKFTDVNTNLIDALKQNPYCNSYLYDEALFQRLNYLSLKTNYAPLENMNISPYVDYNSEKVITPENKCSQIILVSSLSPVSAPKKKVGRSLKFDISESDKKEEEIKKPISPLLFSSRTPAVASKIRIYHPTSIKTTRKKKVVEQLSSPAEERQNIEAKNEVLKSSKKVKTNLKTQTKLLTEKLKKASIPNVVITNETGCSKINHSESKSRIMKNFTSQLESVKSVENNINTNSASASINSDTGAIKKRTRSKRVV